MELPLSVIPTMICIGPKMNITLNPILESYLKRQTIRFSYMSLKNTRRVTQKCGEAETVQVLAIFQVVSQMELIGILTYLFTTILTVGEIHFKKPFMNDKNTKNSSFSELKIFEELVPFFRYALRGGMQDFNYHFSNCFEITIEMSCCKYPPLEDLQQEWKNNFQSILRYLKMANMGIKGFITDRATGKPIQGYHTHALSFFLLM